MTTDDTIEGSAPSCVISQSNHLCTSERRGLEASYTALCHVETIQPRPTAVTSHRNSLLTQEELEIFELVTSCKCV